VTQANIDAEVLARSRRELVVVLVWSPHSESSVYLGHALAEIAEIDGGAWTFATVNLAADRRAARMFGVQGVPTVVAVAAEDPVSNFSGPRPPDQLRAWIDSVIRSTAATFGGQRPAGDR